MMNPLAAYWRSILLLFMAAAALQSCVSTDFNGRVIGDPEDCEPYEPPPRGGGVVVIPGGGGGIVEDEVFGLTFWPNIPDPDGADLMIGAGEQRARLQNQVVYDAAFSWVDAGTGWRMSLRGRGEGTTQTLDLGGTYNEGDFDVEDLQVFFRRRQSGLILNEGDKRVWRVTLKEDNPHSGRPDLLLRFHVLRGTMP